jgi:hypothetical protein
MAKILIVAIFVLIVVSLGSALWSMFSGRGRTGTATVKALTVRVGLSFALILLLLILSALGIITPNG